jgi:hypothetical protein
MSAGMTQAQTRQFKAVWERDGELFLPTEHAVGPWAADRLHGGPVLGLLARGVEAAVRDPALSITRLTFDLYRPVPTAALRLHVEPLRAGGRLQLLVAALLSEEREVARVTALALRTSSNEEVRTHFAQDPMPEGPEGLETRPLLGDRSDAPAIPRGFHTAVETRWVPQHAAGAAPGPLTIWFRLPIALVAGETASPLQLAAAMADFCNAVASISASTRQSGSPPYINTDTTLYLSRPPRGEWFGLTEEREHERAGISVTQLALSDAAGCFGRAHQARLANSART